MKLSGPRAFRLVVTMMVAVVVAPFFAAIVIATWSGGRGGRSSAELLGTWSTWFADNSTWARTARLVCDYHSPLGSLSAHLMSESPKKSSRCISHINVVQVPNSKLLLYLMMHSMHIGVGVGVDTIRRRQSRILSRWRRCIDKAGRRRADGDEFLPTNRYMEK